MASGARGPLLLVRAAKAGDAQLVARLLGEGRDVSEADESGTALHWALQNGHVEVVRLLLVRQDVELNQAFARGATALYIASQKGHVDVVRLLLSREGVEVNKTTQGGFTALMIASQNGHVEVELLLLARQGVEVNATAQGGATALFMASQNGHLEVVRLLLARKDVAVNKTAQNGATALMMASQQGHVEVVRLLLARQGVEVSQTTSSGCWSALSIASRSGHGAIVSHLVAHRAHGQVRLLAGDAIDSLPADLFKEGVPGFAAQAAALRLPLDVAAALGDTEEERAAADVLASQSASLEAATRSSPRRRGPNVNVNVLSKQIRGRPGRHYPRDACFTAGPSRRLRQGRREPPPLQPGRPRAAPPPPPG
jgi:ankyrin repeat protein